MRIFFLVATLFLNSAHAERVPASGAVDNDHGGLVAGRDTPLKDQAFWRSRPALMEKIRDERAVVVSVRREDIANDQVRFTMNGGGWVSRPKEFCFAISQQYSKLKEVSEHFRTVEFDPNTRQLFLVTEALGYQARMILRVLPVSEDWRSELQWEVVWGHFKGMTGLIGFERVGEGGAKTEMSVNARYEASELPLPRVLMGFALEVITQKVAEKMRAFIEAQPASAAEPSRAPSASADLADMPQLAKIKLPPGFRISLFAKDVPNARSMTLSPKGTLFIGTRKAEVYAIDGAAAAASRGERAGPSRLVADGLNQPNGVAFVGDALYIAEISRVSKIAAADLGRKSKPAVIYDGYPKKEWHGWKYMAVGPDGWLYLPVGAPCNVCKVEDPFASITRLSLDGKKREIIARGIRNTVGFDWDPRTKQLWFTDNGRDMLGEDIPNDELNTAPRVGLNFGFPVCHEGSILDPEFGKGGKCSDFVPPVEKLGAHVAALGMKFYSGTQFPEAYRHRVFIAEHGSWNRTAKSGYRLVTVAVSPEGKSLGHEVFASGWLDGESAWGRPVDLLVMPDGSLLVSDDQSGAVYRISYVGGAGK